MDRYALIGKSLGHSFSPVLHRIIFENRGIKGTYDLYETDKAGLEGLIDKIKTGEIKGFNITIPYKEEALKYIEDISDEARMIASINTLKLEKGKIKGYNTDYYGFGKTLRRNNIEISGKRAFILGTGGGAKSVYYYLKNHGAEEIVLVSREPKGVENLYGNSAIIDYKTLRALGDIDIIINTTPLGMYPHIEESPIEKKVLVRSEAVIDLIYNPLETKLLKMGRELGIKSVNGLYMLVAQGIRSQEIWNDIEFDDEFYHRIYSEVINHVK